MEVKISVVIITLNEEKNIGRCLDSVVDIADEILIVDSFSTDRTQEICKKYSVKFLQHKFEGYSEQKNWANKQASFPHILSLDADEALSEELKKNIHAIKCNWNANAYCFNRLTNYCGKWIYHTGWYPDKKLRLWDRRFGNWQGIIHEKVILTNGETHFLKGNLLHYSYYSISQHIRQMNKFSEIGAKNILQKGKKVSFWKILVNPIVKFLRFYFINLGFLDGFYGFMISEITAFETFLKYSKAFNIQKSRRKNTL
jgi:glycosyltransferase involved in cell wall biosynthesis